ncbi:MAG TPA: hypothetical protein ENH82_12375 [bacterium]|nr:hypothetical protein [bacterium]
MKKLILLLLLLFPMSAYSQWEIPVPARGDTLSEVHGEVQALQDTTTDVHSTLSAFQSANGDTLTDVHTLARALQDSLTDTHTLIRAQQDSLTDVHTLTNTTNVTVSDIESDEHSSTFLYSRKAVQTGTSKADTSAVAFYSFDLTAAADSTYGAAVQILGTADTPRILGNTTFHIAGFMVNSVNSNSLYKVRIVWGASVAAGLAAMTFTETWVFGDSANPQQSQPTAIHVQMAEVATGTEAWVQIANAAGAQTMGLTFDTHEHD